MLGSDDEQDEPDPKVPRIGSLPAASSTDDPFISLSASAAPSAILQQQVATAAVPALITVPEDTALPDDAPDMQSVSDGPP